MDRKTKQSRGSARRSRRTTANSKSSKSSRSRRQKPKQIEYTNIKSHVSVNCSPYTPGDVFGMSDTQTPSGNFDVERNETLTEDEMLYSFLQRGITDIANLLSVPWYWRDGSKRAGIRSLFELFNCKNDFEELNATIAKEFCEHVKRLQPSAIDATSIGWIVNNLLFQLEVVFFKLLEKGKEVENAYRYKLHIQNDRGYELEFNHLRARRVPVVYQYGFPSVITLKLEGDRSSVPLKKCHREVKYSEYVLTYSGGNFDAVLSVNWQGPGLRYGA